MRPEHGFSRKYPYILLWGLLALALLLTSCGRQRIRQPGESGAAFENSTAPGNGAASESGGAPGCPSQEDIAAAQAAFHAFCTQVFQEEMASTIRCSGLKPSGSLPGNQSWASAPWRT